MIVPHTALSCTLPPGEGKDNALEIVVGRDTSAQNAVAPSPISYQIPTVASLSVSTSDTDGGGTITLPVTILQRTFVD